MDEQSKALLKSKIDAAKVVSFPEDQHPGNGL